MKPRLNTVVVTMLCLGVLISSVRPAPAQQSNTVSEVAAPKKKLFIFGGGSPFDLIVALDKHFRTRLVQILTLPEMLTRAEVPKLRVAAEDPRDVLNLYNRLQNPALGQWHYEYENASLNSPPTNMNVLTLVPDKSVIANKIERNGIKVKAVALAGVPEPQWESLAKDINDARSYGAEAVAEKGGSDAFSGSVHFQKESKVLIISGSENYVEMVDSLVTAHRMNAELEMKAEAKPPPPAQNP